MIFKKIFLDIILRVLHWIKGKVPGARTKHIGNVDSFQRDYYGALHFKKDKEKIDTYLYNRHIRYGTLIRAILCAEKKAINMLGESLD